MPRSATAWARPTRRTTTPAGNADSSRLGVWRSSSTNTPRSRGAADQPPEGLAQAEPGHAVVIGLRVAAGQMDAALAVQDVGARPGHLLEHHQPQRAAGHVHAVAHRVGAQQAALFLGAEDIDQRRVVHRIDMLGKSGMPGRLQRRRDARMHRAQPADRGEQAERAAAGGQEQRAIGGGERGRDRRRPRR